MADFGGSDLEGFREEARGWIAENFPAGLKNRANPSQATQSRAQRPVESDVHATDRPSPYCHWARSGSSRAVTSTVCAAGLAVVPL